MKPIQLMIKCTSINTVLFLCAVASAPAQINASLSIQLYAGLNITGDVGKLYQVQYATNLTGIVSWYSLAQFPLTWSPYQWVDTTHTATGQRFYRAVYVDIPTNVVPIANMVFISPGSFIMGSPPDEPVRWDDEGPQTHVTFSRGFWMSRFEVTQVEYLELIGTNPSFFNGLQDWPEPNTDYGIDLNRPVEQVTFNDATAYCDALTAREYAAGRLPDGYVYRLPTEAEWEYACRAGTTTPFSYGNVSRVEFANYNGQYEYPPCGGHTNWCENPSGKYLGRTAPVGKLSPKSVGTSRYAWERI